MFRHVLLVVSLMFTNLACSVSSRNIDLAEALGIEPEFTLVLRRDVYLAKRGEQLLLLDEQSRHSTLDRRPTFDAFRKSGSESMAFPGSHYSFLAIIKKGTLIRVCRLEEVKNPESGTLYRLYGKLKPGDQKPERGLILLTHGPVVNTLIAGLVHEQNFLALPE